MGAEKEKVQPVITGTFPAQRFFNTLAAILSRREGVEITVTVKQEGEQGFGVSGGKGRTAAESRCLI